MIPTASRTARHGMNDTMSCATTRTITTTSTCVNALSAATSSPTFGSRGIVGMRTPANAIAPAFTNAVSLRNPVGALPVRSRYHMTNAPPIASSIMSTQSTSGSVASVDIY